MSNVTIPQIKTLLEDLHRQSVERVKHFKIQLPAAYLLFITDAEFRYFWLHDKEFRFIGGSDICEKVFQRAIHLGLKKE